MKVAWIDSAECRSRLFCSLCQGTGSVEIQWRKDQMRIFALDAVVTCPFDRGLSPAIKTYTTERLAVCETCPESVALEHDAPGCKLVTCGGCNRPGSPSPWRFRDLVERRDGKCPHPAGDRWENKSGN